MKTIKNFFFNPAEPSLNPLLKQKQVDLRYHGRIQATRAVVVLFQLGYCPQTTPAFQPNNSASNNQLHPRSGFTTPARVKMRSFALLQKPSQECNSFVPIKRQCRIACRSQYCSCINTPVKGAGTWCFLRLSVVSCDWLIRIKRSLHAGNPREIEDFVWNDKHVIWHK